MEKNVLFAQSGGPTTVINASCYGIIKKSQEYNTKIYAAKYGIEGILKDNLIELTDLDTNTLEILRFSPSSAFGSCRHNLQKEDVEKILEVIKKYNIGYFFYIGGNDSMETSNKLASAIKKSGLDVKVIGVPKTIDNDLLNTHFCPGYGSAAKYIATSIREMALDADVYDKNSITIAEIMGRDSGFLTAAAALAKNDIIDSPDLIYLPEVPFEEEKFLEDVENIYKKKGKVFIAASEGLKDVDGNYAFLREDRIDSFGNIKMGGIGAYLRHLIEENITKKRVKAVEFNILQRCASHIASKVDNDVAVIVGSAAVKYAVEGNTDMMVSIVKNDDGFTTSLTPLEEVAGDIKTFPKEWIDEENRWITNEAIDYIAPLVQGEAKPIFKNGLPEYIRFI